MKRRLSLAWTPVLFLAVSVLAGTAWAQTIEIPISGTDAVVTIDPGLQFTDSEGITHYRGLIQTSHIEGQDADGVPVISDGEYVVNVNIDMVTGDGDMNVKMAQVMTYGDLEGSWQGTADVLIAGFLFEGPFNYARGSGDFKSWHLRGTVAGVFAGPLNSWDGYFLVPSGDKAAAVESETWSRVKDLFR